LTREQTHFGISAYKRVQGESPSWNIQVNYHDVLSTVLFLFFFSYQQVRFNQA
jgi:hypothetical protein